LGSWRPDVGVGLQGEGRNEVKEIEDEGEKGEGNKEREEGRKEEKGWKSPLRD
jgi:hypothetical protein